MAMEGKTLRKGKFYDDSGKRHEKVQQAFVITNASRAKNRH